MLSWIARAALIVAGLITSWFVSQDAVNFTVIQMTITVLLIMAVVLIAAFWPASWLPRRHPRDEPQDQ